MLALPKYIHTVPSPDEIEFIKKFANKVLPYFEEKEINK